LEDRIPLDGRQWQLPLLYHCNFAIASVISRAAQLIMKRYSAALLRWDA
jgi:hypothetical protein